MRSWGFSVLAVWLNAKKKAAWSTEWPRHSASLTIPNLTDSPHICYIGWIVHLAHKCVIWFLYKIRFDAKECCGAILSIYGFDVNAAVIYEKVDMTTFFLFATLSGFLVVFATMIYAMHKIKKENPIDALKKRKYIKTRVSHTRHPSFLSLLWYEFFS